MQEELQVTKIYIYILFFSILGWHFSVRDKPSALQMIRPLPQHTLRRGKVAGSQLELSSWQHIFADYAKAATFSFRGTSQLFPLPCQSQSQICNRFHLGRAESAPKRRFLHARARSRNTRSLTAILRGQHQLYQPTELSQAAREGTSTENRLLSSHYVLMPDLLLDELYKKTQHQASFVHSCLWRRDCSKPRELLL